MIFAIKPLATHWNFSNPARYMSRYHFSYMNLGKVRKTFGGQVWVKYEPLVNWVSSDMHVGQEAMSCNVCPVAIPEICAQTQGSDYWQLIHWCQSTCGPSVSQHMTQIIWVFRIGNIKNVHSRKWVIVDAHRTTIKSTFNSVFRGSFEC